MSDEDEPIVVLHGGPDFGHDYLLPDLDRLADVFRLVYYDQRGRGRSFSGEPTRRDLDRDRDRRPGSGSRLDRPRVGRPARALVGWASRARVRDPSSGSGVPSHPHEHRAGLARRHARLSGRARGQPIARADRADRRLALRPGVPTGDIAADAEYYRIHFSTALRRPEHLDQVVRQLRVGSSPEGIVAARAIEDTLYAQTWSADDYDLLPGLRRLRIPTLLIHGEHDLIPLDIARRIATAIPGSRLVVLADCGHFGYMEQPDRVHAVIAEFLAPP